MAYPLHVMTTGFVQTAVIDSYESLRFTRKFYEVGTAEVHIQRGKNGEAALQKGAIIFVRPQHPFLILGRKDNETKKGVSVTLTGKQLKGICSRRLTVPDPANDALTHGYDRYPLPGSPELPAESVIKYYANRHLIACSDMNRRFPGLILATDQGRGSPLRWSSRFESLDAVFKAIGEYAAMGYDIRIDPDALKFIFDAVPGTDHSASGTDPVIFGVQFGNIETMEHVDDDSQLVNAAYCGGAGENEARLIQTVFPNNIAPIGFGRCETWFDCGSLEAYEDLIYEGKYRLSQNVASESLKGNVIQSGPFSYLEDYDLGDVVTIKSVAMGVEQDARITEVEEVYEKGSLTVSLTFGKRKPTILDEIRKTEARR